jgi:RimJ/RimL family protein N-acetyltransferase
MRYWNSPPMAHLGEAGAFIAKARASFSQRLSLRWGIVRRTGGRLIGTCALFHFDGHNDCAEIGYALARNFWGQGFNHEPWRPVLDYAFATLNLHRVEARARPEERRIHPPPSSELGFVREGVLRERCNVNGELSDSLVMGPARTRVRQRPVRPEEEP